MPIDRPTCDVPGCEKKAHPIKTIAHGKFRRASWIREQYGAKEGWCCIVHHMKKYNMGTYFFSNLKKSYCENVDGRLGFTCTTTIVDRCQLQVDHVDGNPSNNDKKNLQTLCGSCHLYKTYRNGDDRSPGRIQLGLK